ncbi:MAG: hypothetical protein ABUL73_03380 [Alphaproteobacteria bacterium]
MRASAIALVAALAMVAAGPASARPWTDPAGRVTFNLPAGWSQESHPCEDCTSLDAFNPSRDCYIFAKPRPADPQHTIQPAHVRSIMRDDTKITNDIWTSNANDFQMVFANNSATFVSRSLLDSNDTRFWPIQRAEFTNGDGKHVFGALQMRPNMELWAFCVAAGSGADDAGNYDAVLNSIGTPQDAQLQTDVTTAEAAAAAAAAQAAAHPQPPPQQQQQGHRNTHGDHAEDH